ncbi:Uma2 family endonuclease [soil metagenome]
MDLLVETLPRDAQIAFNRRRWEEVCADPTLAGLPHKIETDALGHIIMMPPAKGSHSSAQSTIHLKLHDLMGARALVECPISTIGGVRTADVGWYSPARYREVNGQPAFERAPEICVEVLSPSNTPREMAEKRDLYFEAGADEFWICNPDGRLDFFLATNPDSPAVASKICPGFPAQLPAS